MKLELKLLPRRGGQVSQATVGRVVAREAIDQAIQNGKRLVSMLVSSDPIGLPIGFDANVEGKIYTLGIIGMTFTPKKGTMACAFRLETPDLTNGQSTNFIDFGARDLVFTPSSFGATNGTTEAVRCRRFHAASWRRNGPEAKGPKG